jgi:hypothetical protein
MTTSIATTTDVIIKSSALMLHHDTYKQFLISDRPQDDGLVVNHNIVLISLFFVNTFYLVIFDRFERKIALVMTRYAALRGSEVHLAHAPSVKFYF